MMTNPALESTQHFMRLLNDEVNSKDPTRGLPFSSSFEVTMIFLRVAFTVQEPKIQQLFDVQYSLEKHS